MEQEQDRIWTNDKVFEFMQYMRDYEDFYDYIDNMPEELKKLISSWINQNK